MTKDLNEQLRDHYQKKKLSKVQSEALMGLSKQRQLRMYIGAIAASAALVIVLISSQLQYSISDMANEVSYNHLKGMPVEVITTNYDELNQALDRLDFKARQSVKLASFFTLEGARYCSIDGKIAAQIKLTKTATGETYTLYQFKVEGHEGVSDNPQNFRVDGVEIEIWREGEIGFALAQTL